MNGLHNPCEESFTFNRETIAYIQQAAERGLYDIRGLGAKQGDALIALHTPAGAQLAYSGYLLKRKSSPAGR